MVPCSLFYSHHWQEGTDLQEQGDGSVNQVGGDGDKEKWIQEILRK